MTHPPEPREPHVPIGTLPKVTVVRFAKSVISGCSSIAPDAGTQLDANRANFELIENIGIHDSHDSQLLAGNTPGVAEWFRLSWRPSVPDVDRKPPENVWPFARQKQTNSRQDRCAEHAGDLRTDTDTRRERQSVPGFAKSERERAVAAKVASLGGANRVCGAL